MADEIIITQSQDLETNPEYIEFGPHIKLYGFTYDGFTSATTTEQVMYLTEDAVNKGIDEAIYPSPLDKAEDITVYRSSPDRAYDKFLGCVKNSNQENIRGIYDYNVPSNSNFRYYLMTNSKFGGSVIQRSDFLNVTWNKWSLVDLYYDEENNIYNPGATVFLMDCNASQGSITKNIGVVKYDSLSRFGKLIKTGQNYESGNLTFLMGKFEIVQNIQKDKRILFADRIKRVEVNNIEIECFYDSEGQVPGIYATVEELINKIWPHSMYYYTFDYIYVGCVDKYYTKEKTIATWEACNSQLSFNKEIDKIAKWKECMTNSQPKLLKAPNGGTWVIGIPSSTQEQIKYLQFPYPSEFTFDWQEIMDKDKITVLGWDAEK